MYRYEHRDGRTGRGDTAWKSIEAALGGDWESFPSVYEPAWSYLHSGEIYKVSQLVSRDDDSVLGVLAQLDD